MESASFGQRASFVMNKYGLAGRSVSHDTQKSGSGWAINVCAVATYPRIRVYVGNGHLLFSSVAAVGRWSL